MTFLCFASMFSGQTEFLEESNYCVVIWGAELVRFLLIRGSRGGAYKRFYRIFWTAQVMREYCLDASFQREQPAVAHAFWTY